MSETLHSRNRVRIAEEMQSGNNVISRLMKAKADTKTSTMRTAALSGLGLNVTVAVGQQKPIAMNIKQRIVGTRGKQKGEPMARYIDADKLIEKAKKMNYQAISIPMLKAEQTAEQPERKTGKWEMKWHSFFKREVPTCSVCKAGFFFITNFCPKCGAEMRKGGQCENS